MVYIAFDKNVYVPLSEDGKTSHRRVVFYVTNLFIVIFDTHLNCSPVRLDAEDISAATRSSLPKHAVAMLLSRAGGKSRIFAVFSRYQVIRRLRFSPDAPLDAFKSLGHRASQERAPLRDKSTAPSGADGGNVDATARPARGIRHGSVAVRSYRSI